MPREGNPRQFGNKIYIDLEIAVPGEIPLNDAHAIAERVHGAVERRFPNVKHVMIHVNPENDTVNGEESNHD